MSKADTDSENNRSKARQKIIEEAIEGLYQARATAQRERLTRGEVSESTRASLQQAIMDLYWALRPLRNESAVDDWWTSVELSDNLTTRSADVDGHMYGSGVDIDVSESVVTGLDYLKTLDSMTTKTSSTTKTMRGRKTETTVKPVILDYQTLTDISGVLDDAASKLGFTPKPPIPDETDPDPV